MSRLLDIFRRRRPAGSMDDDLAPRGDHLQMILKCRGEPKAAIYVDDEREIRSPALQEGQTADAPTSRNT